MKRLAAPLAAAMVVLWCLLLGWSPLRDLDWGWHLATFERWMAEGQLPWDDRFSYASERAYEPVHTLFQLAIGHLHRAFGTKGLVLYKMALHAAIGLALWAGLRRRGAGPWGGAALALVVLAASTWRLLERPHLFTTLGLVLLLDRLVAIRERGAHPWPLVPLLAAWSCAHPGVVFGALALTGFVLAEGLWSRWRRAPTPAWLMRLAAWTAPALLATGLNPLSWDLYPYLVLGHRELQHAVDIAELRGLFQHPERGVAEHARMAGLWLLGAALLLRRARRIDPTLGLMALAFAVLGVILAREAPLALIVLAFALAPALGRARRLSPAGRALLLALALLPGLSHAALHARGLVRRGLRAPAVEPDYYPVQPAEWLAGHKPVGRLWNTNRTGGYLVWRLSPLGMQVHTDGRMPMYPRALLESREPPPGEPWAVEARWRPEVLVFDWGPRVARNLAYYPERAPGFHERWALVHVSSGGKVYLRRGGLNGDLVARFGYREMRWAGRLLLPARDPATLARELARARKVDPANPHLPPP